MKSIQCKTSWRCKCFQLEAQLMQIESSLQSLLTFNMRPAINLQAKRSARVLCVICEATFWKLFFSAAMCSDTTVAHANIEAATLRWTNGISERCSKQMSLYGRNLSLVFLCEQLQAHFPSCGQSYPNLSQSERVCGFRCARCFSPSFVVN